MERGALFVQVKPPSGGTFLATCALGFQTGSVATGVFASPDPNELCAVAGGYAYLIDTQHPEQSSQVPLRPVVEVVKAEQALIFVGFHSIVVRDPTGTWDTPRLSWEGITIDRVQGNVIHGKGWDMPADRDVPFTIDLRTHTCTGGGYKL